MKSFYLPTSHQLLHNATTHHKSIKSTQFKPYPIYKLEVSSLFEKYQHNTSKIKSTSKLVTTSRNRFNLFNNQTKDDCLHSKEKEEISRILSKPRNKDNNCLSYDNDPVIKIDQSSTEYEDPLESFAVLKNNQQIMNNIKMNHYQRELQSFTKRITDINSIKLLFKNKGKIRVKPVRLKKIMNFKKTPVPRMSEANLIAMSSDLKIKLNGLHLYPNKNLPESRQQFTLVADSYSNDYVNYIYLYGGQSSNSDMKSLWRINVNKLTWECIKSTKLQPLPRYGHTCVHYKHKLVLFGGKMLYASVLAGLDIFDIDTREWSSPELPNINNLKPRYGHIACVIDQHMLIHGGSNEFDEVLNETVLLSFASPQLKWSKCCIDTNICQSPYRSMHSSCLVLPEEVLLSPRFNIYSKFTDVNIGTLTKSIQEIGVYIFGGKDKAGKRCSNDLFVLHLFNPKLDWMKITTQGIGPSQRYLTSMTYYSMGNLIFIHGGRTEVNGTINELSDIYALDLSKFNWIQIVLSNMVLQRRCGHACFVLDDYYFIFGGMNNENYLKSSFEVVNLVNEGTKLDSNHINKLQQINTLKLINQSPKKKLRQFRLLSSGNINLSDLNADNK